MSCMDRPVKYLDNDLKSYSNLTTENGHILLNPGEKSNVKAFIQCTRYQYRLVIDPALTLFPVVNLADYI